jgi:hypothetical protein
LNIGYALVFSASKRRNFNCSRRELATRNNRTQFASAVLCFCALFSSSPTRRERKSANSFGDRPILNLASDSELLYISVKERVVQAGTSSISLRPEVKADSLTGNFNGEIIVARSLARKTADWRTPGRFFRTEDMRVSIPFTRSIEHVYHVRIPVRHNRKEWLRS